VNTLRLIPQTALSITLAETNVQNPSRDIRNAAVEYRIIANGDTPHESQICTSPVERLNLSVRIGMRRFTRLTNAFSKSPRHHEVATALWICFYNFCRPHMTLKTTPAVKAGLIDAVWTVEPLLDELAAVPGDTLRSESHIPAKKRDKCFSSKICCFFWRQRPITSGNALERQC
jgi:hypothetical protein